jgi:superoxide dismutase, Fe-Mn family
MSRNRKELEALMKTLLGTVSRRDMVKVSAGAALAAVVPVGTVSCGGDPESSGVVARGPAAALLGSIWDQGYPFALPELPYPAYALEAAIDTQTMEIHHGRHHQGYVNNLNAALEGHASLHGRTLVELVASWEELPQEVRTAVRNHGGGHLNHALFWTSLSPEGGGEPVGALAEAITGRFGSFASFREEFSRATGSVFGSGWGWLAADGDGTLQIVSTPNQDNPVSRGMTPLLGLDVWEHAYYLRYQNRRADYIQAFWEVVGWEEVGRRLSVL